MKNVYDDDLIKVNEVEDGKDEADKGNVKLIIIPAAVMATIIIIGSTLIKTKINDKNITSSAIENTIEQSFENQNNNYNDRIIATNNNENYNQEQVIPGPALAPVETSKNDIQYEQEETNTIVETEDKSDIAGPEIDYSNVSSFYAEIAANRQKYGKFAESFQSEEDVINLINFFCKFDSRYKYSNTDTTITSQEQFDEIIRDYYKSCVAKNVPANLSSIFKKDSIYEVKLKESETFANDLKNGKGKDYTIANKYYTWFLVNLCDDRTALAQTHKNAPLIDALREQYEEYRNVGNMLAARKYQKNDSLPVENIDIYYRYVYPEGVKEVQNSFSCPDWGVDNVVSKTEEKTETKLVKHLDDSTLFQIVDEAFDDVLESSRTR